LQDIQKVVDKII